MRAGLLVPLPCAVSERVSWGFAMLFRGKKRKPTWKLSRPVNDLTSLEPLRRSVEVEEKIRIYANEICRE